LLRTWRANAVGRGNAAVPSRYPGFLTAEPVQRLVRQGRAASVQFAADVPPGHCEGTAIGTVTVGTGGVWEGQLYRHIDRSDLFLLFWSSAARDSLWVLKEVAYALECQGRSVKALPEIVPVLLEGPPPPEPPDARRHLHFNDYLLYLLRPLGRT
jgi:TIR domain